MQMLWPGMLYLLGIIPLLIFAYILILRRRKRFAVRFSSLSLVRDAMPKSSKWRRHFPFALFMLAVAFLIMALTRPQSTVTVPASNATIILAIDVSRSMCSTDIAPNRLEAAKQSALDFIEAQNPNTQMGIVAFAGYAVLVQPPTTNRADLETAVRNLTTARRTAIGEGILTSIDAISQIDDSVISPYAGVTITPVPQGQYVPAIIVLLTDGVSTTGIPPLEAVQYAVDQGIKVYTIGFGTQSNNSPMICGVGSQNADQFQFDQFPGPFFGGGGGGFRRELDEDTLKQIAEKTGATYHLAESASELQGVFDNLSKQFFTVTETIEISAFFAAAAAFLMTIAIALSIMWNTLL